MQAEIGSHQQPSPRLPSVHVPQPLQEKHAELAGPVGSNIDSETHKSGLEPVRRSSGRTTMPAAHAERQRCIACLHARDACLFPSSPL